RQAIRLARYAGAERDATSELQEAEAQLEQAENAWRLKQDTAEIDRLARRATSIGASAEEQAEARKAARLRREDIARRDEAVRQAEKTTATAEQQIEDLRAALSKETRARELADRDLASANQQLRDLRSEVARLRDEVQTTRTQSEDAKVKLARLEGERSVEVARRESEQRLAQQREAAATLKQTLARYGTIRETERGMVLTLPDSLWTSARASQLTPAAAAKIEPLAALLANNPDYQVVIEVHTDNRGDTTSLQQLTQDRAEALARQFIASGVADARIQANGQGAAKPIAPNTRPAGRLRNRRTEITLVPTSATSTASTN
nr:OmpA family protein [Pyrinomonadaceae bacterium]